MSTANVCGSGLFLIMCGLFVMLGGDLFRLMLATRAYFKHKELIQVHKPKMSSKFSWLKFMMILNWILFLLAGGVLLYLIHFLSLVRDFGDSSMAIFNASGTAPPGSAVLYLAYLFFLLFGAVSGMFLSLDGLTGISIVFPAYRALYGLGAVLHWRKEKRSFGKAVDMVFSWLSASLLVSGVLCLVLTS